MKIIWSNVFVLCLVFLAVVIWIRHHSVIGGFLGHMDQIGPGHFPDDRLLGLMAFGLVAVCIVAIVRILTRRN